MSEQALPLDPKAGADESELSELEQQLARAESQYAEALARYFRAREELRALQTTSGTSSAVLTAAQTRLVTADSKCRKLRLLINRLEVVLG